MKKVLLIIVALLFVIGTGLSTYISMIDWNQHKDKIAAQFSDITGKKIVFEGPVSFSIFPEPYLTASDIKIYNQGAGEGTQSDEPLAEIKSLVAKLSLVPLLSGDFDVKRMSLVEPNIVIEKNENGEVNWQSQFTDDQKYKLENMEVTLDSVTLEKAKITIVDLTRNINLKLDNLNAEVIAQSIFGPYRIEGSYVKDNNPEGFAISLGKFSDSFATTLNLALNHPTSETFLRFDGSFLLKNNAVNGNVIFESKKLMDFVNSTFKKHNITKDYDYPLAVSLELNTNQTKVDLTNIVVKYGETIGAGNLLMPLQEAKNGEEKARTKIEVAFNMTDFDLNPFIAYIKQNIATYKTQEYKPNIPFDFIADFKAIKTTYNDQNIKDLSLSLDLKDNVFVLNSLNATFPGDTSFALKGEVFPLKDALSYTFETAFNSNESLRLFNWLNIKPDVVSPATYKKTVGTFKVEGDLLKAKISPAEVVFDKSSIKGDLGVVFGARPNIFAMLNVDMINFDNYVASLPKEELQKSFAERMNFRFSKLGFLNNYEIQTVSKLGLGIYENLPFENMQINANLTQGVLKIESLNIGGIANSAVEASGTIKGFGSSLAFENLKYALDTKDLSTLFNKFEYQAPDIDMKQLKKFNAKGITTGNLNRFVIKNYAKLENIDFSYVGRVNKVENDFNFEGDLEVKNPDFVKLLNSLNIKYSPPAFSLGVFNLKTRFLGNTSKFVASSLNFNIGINDFAGNLKYDNSTGRKNIEANLKVNKFEVERFLYNNTGKSKDNKVVSFRPSGGEASDFLIKPFYDAEKLNYAFYSTFDFKGNLSFDKLSMSDYNFDAASFELSLLNSVANINNFNAKFVGGKVVSNIEYGMTENPYIKGNANFIEQIIFENNWGGRKYGLKSGKLNAKVNFETKAVSQLTMFSELDANVDFFIADAVVKGWSITTIYDDLIKRDLSEGMVAFVKNNLQDGTTNFSKINGKIDISKSNLKFVDTYMEAKNLKIDVKGDANLNTWEANTAFIVDFAEPQYLPSFSFTLSGSMVSPVLEVNLDALTKMYNARQAEFEAHRKALEEEQVAKLKRLMEAQQLVAKSLKSDVETVLSIDLEQKKSQTNKAEVLEAYRAVEAQMAETQKLIEQVFTLGMTPEYTEELINSATNKNEQATKDIEVIKTRLRDIFLSDVKNRINSVYNQIADTHNESKSTVRKFRRDFAGFAPRLSVIETKYSLTMDANITELNKNIDKAVLDLDALNNQISSEFIKIKESKNSIELEDYVKDIAKKLEIAKTYIQVLNNNIIELNRYVEEVVSKEETDYANRKKEAEVKKKLEENIGKISVKGTGKSMTVSRDIEDIEKAEEAQQKEELKVLDFSGKTPKSTISVGSVVKDVSEDKANTILKESGNLIVKPSGEISKASGVIKKR